MKRSICITDKVNFRIVFVKENMFRDVKSSLPLNIGTKNVPSDSKARQGPEGVNTSSSYKFSVKLKIKTL